MSGDVKRPVAVVPAVVVRAEDQFVVLVEHRSGRLPLRDSIDGMQCPDSDPMTWTGADGVVEKADLTFLSADEMMLLRSQWRAQGVLLYQVGSFRVQDPLGDPAGYFLSFGG